MSSSHDAGSIEERAAFRKMSPNGIKCGQSALFPETMEEVDDGTVQMAFHQVHITREPLFIDRYRRASDTECFTHLKICPFNILKGGLDRQIQTTAGFDNGSNDKRTFDRVWEKSRVLLHKVSPGQRPQGIVFPEIGA